MYTFIRIHFQFWYCNFSTQEFPADSAYCYKFQKKGHGYDEVIYIELSVKGIKITWSADTTKWAAFEAK